MKSRRQLLLTLSAVSVTAWKQPVISSVVLPTHASMSELRCPTQDDEDIVCDCLCSSETDQDVIECLAFNGLIESENCPSTDFDCVCFSDIRLKTKIAEIGQTSNGLALYSFQYINDSNQIDYVGVMAQDLLLTHPEAVLTGDDGYYRVAYSQLGLKMSTLDAWQEHGIKAVTFKLH